MEVIKGKQVSAPKLIIYGSAGSGKSTLASQLKRPIFLDFEDGLKYLDVVKTPQIHSVAVFYTYLVELYKQASEGKREYDTVVIDSMDWCVTKIMQQAAGIDKAHLDETLNKSNGGYGNGKQVLDNHIRIKLIGALAQLNNLGYTICLIAHAEQKTLLNPDGTNTVKISPKIDANTMEVFVEWVDNVFYLRKDTNGERTILLEADNATLAKNRMGLTGEVNLGEIDINKLLSGDTNFKKEK